MISDTPFCIIQPGKQKSVDLANAVVKGCGRGEIFVAGRYDFGVSDIPEHMTPVFIGVHDSFIDLLFFTHRARRPFITIDNGYMRPYLKGGYFRATSNAFQWISKHAGGRGRRGGIPFGSDRFAKLNISPPAPFKIKKEGHVLVLLQSPKWFEYVGESPSWLQAVETALSCVTDREVIVRHKPLKGAASQPSFEEHLKGAYAVVGYSSAGLLQAALEGIPVFPLAECAASALGTADLSRMDNPPEPGNIKRVFHDLAANQWTIPEIANGQMWREIQERYEPEFYSLS